MEMPYALSYLAHACRRVQCRLKRLQRGILLLFGGRVGEDPDDDKDFAWLDATALRRMSKLDLHHMASGPGGQAMLDMFHKMHKAMGVFPWTIIGKDVIRRDM